MDNLGIRLKVARIKSGLSQKETVEKMEYENEYFSQSYLSKLENDVNEPSLGQLKAFSKIYNIDILELIYSDIELSKLKDSK